MAWHVYSEVIKGEMVNYNQPPPATENVQRLKGVEFSGDGCWATVYDGSNPVKVFVWMTDWQKRPKQKAGKKLPA